jgi:hypothetical protein
VCADHAPSPADPLRDPQTVNVLAPSSRPDTAQASADLLVEGADQAGPQRTDGGNHRRRRRNETAESDVGLSPDRATDRPGPWDFDQQRMWCDAFSPFGTARRRTRLSWLTVLGHTKDVCGASTCFDANRPSCAPMRARRHGPLHASHRGLCHASRRAGWVPRPGATPSVRNRVPRRVPRSVRRVPTAGDGTRDHNILGGLSMC